MLEAADAYYRRRENQERVMAGRSRDPDVRSIHERLADAYAGRAAQQSSQAIGDRI